MTVVYLGPPIRFEAQSGRPLLVEVTGASTSTSSVRASRAGDGAKARRCSSHFRVMNADLRFAPERPGCVPGGRPRQGEDPDEHHEFAPVFLGDMIDRVIPCRA
jgi:hypothetical protein